MPRLGWQKLVRWSAAVVFVLTAAAGASLRDREALVIAALLLVANGLLRWRSGLLGMILAGLLAADIAFWMLPAAAVNVSEHEGLLAVGVPTLLAATAAVLLVGVVAALVRSRRPSGDSRCPVPRSEGRSGPVPRSEGRSGPALVAGAGLAAVVVALAVGLVGDREGRRPGDVVVEMRDTTFEPDVLAVPPGQIVFYVNNHDLFWHTFSIDGTDVDVRLPVSGHRRITAQLDPGTYEIVCRIPGHETVGMTGTVEVG